MLCIITHLQHFSDDENVREPSLSLTSEFRIYDLDNNKPLRPLHNVSSSATINIQTCHVWQIARLHTQRSSMSKLQCHKIIKLVSFTTSVNTLYIHSGRGPFRHRASRAYISSDLGQLWQCCWLHSGVGLDLQT